MICKPSLLLLTTATFSWNVSFCAAGETNTERRDRLRQMSSVEKEELSQKQARFERLPETERERLRTLDAKLDAAPDGERLREVMLRYSAWLRTLKSSQRAALLKMPTEARIAAIKALVEQGERQRFQEMFDYRLQPNDQKMLLTWIARLIERDEKRMLEPLSQLERQRLHQITDKTRRYMVLAMMYRKHFGEELRLFDLLKPMADDLETLATSLSRPAREMLDEPRDATERDKLLQSWVLAAMESRMHPQVTTEQLRRFWADELTAEQRERLESLPRERMRFELRRLYLQSRAKRARDTK